MPGRIKELPGPIRIYCVDKGRVLAGVLEEALGSHPVHFSFERSVYEALDHLDTQAADLVAISDTAIRDEDFEDSFELLELMELKVPETRILVFTSPERVRRTLRAMRSKAFHRVPLNAGPTEVRERLVSVFAERPPVLAKLPAAGEERVSLFSKMIGHSAAIQNVYRQIRQAAATDIPVLLTGETGCGKELAAHAIFDKSHRRTKPYLPVHMGALPSELVSDELLGHEKGAFTNATHRKKGCFEEANGGTVFLDEISTIDAKTQISLLRILEQRQFNRLGGHSPVKTDVRIIAASNTDLTALVRSGAFREDLFYRLDVMHIDLPPLRERHNDIPLLVTHFLEQSNRDFNKQIQGLSPDVLAALENYDWPGNVRELKNLIQRASVLCEGPILTLDHLPRRFRQAATNPRTFSVKIGSTLNEVEHELIRHTLRHAGGNRTRAASILGISRRALYNKLGRYDLK